MALLWLDSFDSYGTTVGGTISPGDSLSRKYSYVNGETSMKVGSGRYGGYSVYCTYVYGKIDTPIDLTTDRTIILGMAIKMPAFTDNAYLLQFFANGLQGITLKLCKGSGIEVLRGTTLLTTVYDVLEIDTWQFWEVKVYTHQTEGSVEVRINEDTICSLTNVDTQPGIDTYHDEVRLMINTVNFYPRLDDLYICDGTGDTNNDFIGDARVYPARPNGDSSTVEWATSTGSTHYTLVDEAAANDDTDYVESSTQADQDIWDYESLLTEVASVKGLQVNTDVRVTDTTSLDLKTVVQSGSTESSDAGTTISEESYSVVPRVLEEDPDTDSSWTVAGVNALKAGVGVG